MHANKTNFYIKIIIGKKDVKLLAQIIWTMCKYVINAF